MGARTRYLQSKAREETSFKTIEDIDKEEGWSIIRRFKNKAEMARFVNDPNNIADLDYNYPLYNYRRKLDLDRHYIAVLRK
jgi:hypothetical protein